MAKKREARLGDVGYRNGARDRLEEAFALLQEELFGGCVYLAGRAVEGMLRGVIWKGDPGYASGRKTLNTGHNLRDMLKLIKNLGAIDRALSDSITGDIQRVSRLWSNDMRFWPTTMVRQYWYELGGIGKKRTLKLAAREYYIVCSEIIRRCEALWRS